MNYYKWECIDSTSDMVKAVIIVSAYSLIDSRLIVRRHLHTLNRGDLVPVISFKGIVGSSDIIYSNVEIRYDGTSIQDRVDKS